ncbi:hypothetical protein RRG08_019715, partial [Elysia crispata]
AARTITAGGSGCLHLSTGNATSYNFLLPSFLRYLDIGLPGPSQLEKRLSPSQYR